MNNIVKQELTDFLEVMRKNKGIVIYVIIFSLFVFFICAMTMRRDISIAYLVCSLGSLVNLVSIEKNKDDLRRDIKRVFYIILFTLVSIGFLFIPSRSVSKDLNRNSPGNRTEGKIGVPAAMIFGKLRQRKLK